MARQRKKSHFPAHPATHRGAAPRVSRFSGDISVPESTRPSQTLCFLDTQDFAGHQSFHFQGGFSALFVDCSWVHRVSKVAQGFGLTSQAGFVPHGFLAVMCGCCRNSESLSAAKPMANKMPRPPQQQGAGLQ